MSNSNKMPINLFFINYSWVSLLKANYQTLTHYMRYGLMAFCNQPNQFPELIDLTINDNLVPIPVHDGDDIRGGLMELCRQPHQVNDDNDNSRGLKPNIPDISESKKKRKIKNQDSETDVKKKKLSQNVYQYKRDTSYVLGGILSMTKHWHGRSVHDENIKLNASKSILSDQLFPHINFSNHL